MALTAEQQKLREGKVTASFFPALVFGNEEKILNEWRKLVGDPDYVDEFKDTWLTEFGSYMEPFMLNWRERKNGHKLTRRGEVVYHPVYTWASCTLDAVSDSEDMVIDCKTLNNFRDKEQAIQYYSWQVLGQAAITGKKRCSLYISQGGMEPEDVEIERNEMMETALWTKAKEFWNCVETLTPPVAMASSFKPNVKLDLRKIDMTGNNSWSAYADDWLKNKEPAKKFEEAKEGIKKLIEADVGEASGHGIVAKRSKDNKISIKELKV